MAEEENSGITSKEKIRTTITYTLMYLIAFFVSYFLYEFAIFISGKIFGLDIEPFHHRTDQFLLRQYSHLSADVIISTGISGLLMALILAILFFRAFIIFKTGKGLLKIFFLFAYLHSFNILLGGIFASIFTKTPAGILMEFANINFFIKFVIGILCLFLVGYVSSFAANYFMQTANYVRFTDKQTRHVFLLNAVLKPWFFSTLIILFINIPQFNLFEFIILLTFIFVISPIFKRQYDFFEIAVIEEQKEYKPTIFLILLVIIFLLFYRFFVS